MDIDPAGRIAAARHLDTVRPGPDHPTLPLPVWLRTKHTCSRTDCPNMATHTIETTVGPVQVCTSHFTEWAAARPI
jgi:hypothetical protein